MQLLLNALITGSFAALMAGGLWLVYSMLGVFNLALGQLALVGGYATWWFHQSLGLPLPLSIIGGIGIAALVTWISFEISIAPFYRLHNFLPWVSTMALGMILDGLFLIIFQEQPRSILPGLKRTVELGGAIISIEQIILISCTLLLLGCAAYVLRYTSLGRTIRATVQGTEASQALGIPAFQLHRLVFIGSGVLAGIAGIYTGIDHNLTPTLGFPLTIKAYAALIVGGKDSFIGTIVAAYLIALLEQIAVGTPWFFGNYISAGYQSVVALLFIIVILLFKPTGLFSRRLRIA